MASLRSIGLILALFAGFALLSCTTDSTEPVAEVSTDSDTAVPSASEPVVDNDLPTPAEALAEATQEASAPTNTSPAESTESSTSDAAIEEAVNELEKKHPSVDTTAAAPTVVESPAPTTTDNSVIPASNQDDNPSIVAVGKEAKTKVRKPKQKKARTHESPRPQAEASSTTGSTFYIVVSGDTLGKIAQTLYGDRTRWRELADLNKLKATDKIFPGDKLSYTADAATSAYEAALQNLAKQTLTVKKGDTLHSLAAKVLGSAGQWQLLWRWNDSILADPNKIRPGMELSFVAPQDLASLHAERVGKDAH